MDYRGREWFDMEFGSLYFFIPPLHISHLCAIIHTIISNDEASAAKIPTESRWLVETGGCTCLSTSELPVKAGRFAAFILHAKRSEGYSSPDNLGGTAEAMLSSHMQNQCVGRRHFLCAEPRMCMICTMYMICTWKSASFAALGRFFRRM